MGNNTTEEIEKCRLCGNLLGGKHASDCYYRKMLQGLGIKDAPYVVKADCIKLV